MTRLQPKQLLINAGLLAASAVAVYGIFVFANQMRTDAVALELVQSYGYAGMLVAAFIGGFNILVPVPAAALTPVFLEAGFSIFLIIGTLVIGTTIADSIAYVLGRIGRMFTKDSHPIITNKIEAVIEKYPKWVVPTVFLYASFMPFPNEVLMVPFGLANYRYSTILVPLLLGNVINQTILAYGFNSVFGLLF